MDNFDTIHCRRVVATAAALDGATWPSGALIMRIAPDDVLVIGDGDIAIDDVHAIVCDEAGFSGMWLDYEAFAPFAESHIHWSLPTGRPVLAQGLLAQVPVKLWLGSDSVLLLVATVSKHELTKRLS